MEPAGVAVGALLIRKRKVQTVIKLLDERSWRKKRAGVAKIDGDIMAVAVAPEGARAFDIGGGLPDGLADLIGSGDVRWASGMRIAPSSSPAAAAASGNAPPSLDTAAPSSSSFTFIELFAGLGGFRLGLAALGGKCVFASEIDPLAAAAYARNFGDDHLHGDITSVATSSIPPHDILTAGFPCQSFSRVGEQKGLADERGDLFHEIVRCAIAGRPKALLLENVPNLLRVDDGHAIHTIIEALTRCGYHCRLHVLNALAFVPQHRERLFIVCFRCDLVAAAGSHTKASNEWSPPVCCENTDLYFSPHHTPAYPSTPHPTASPAAPLSFASHPPGNSASLDSRWSSERFKWPPMPHARPSSMATVRSVLEPIEPIEGVEEEASAKAAEAAADVMDARGAHSVPPNVLAKYQLTASQWQVVRSSHGYRQKVHQAPGLNRSQGLALCRQSQASCSHALLCSHARTCAPCSSSP